MADVVVVGAGPSGLAAAAALRRAGVTDVVVLDREPELGGIPRHSHHSGYGLRDLGRAVSGPAYARARVARAVAAGADLRAASTVTGWDPPLAGAAEPWFTVDVTSPAGRYQLPTRAIVLATGCRERPRAARLVPGGRPAGVMTTGQLQQTVYVERMPVGERAVVVGAEHVSYSAAVTLAHAGCRVVAMTTEYPRPTSYTAFDRIARARWRFPLHAQTLVSRVLGTDRVCGVELTEIESGATRDIACDTVVFTGDWVADHELARRHDVVVDPASSGVVVDTGLRTSQPGVFAVGNLNHPAETADLCALDGQHVAQAVVSWLVGPGWPSSGVPIQAQWPLSWVSPAWVSDAATPPRGRLVLRAETFRRAPRLRASQGERELWSGRVPWVVPTRPVTVPAGWLAGVARDIASPPVVLSLD